MYNQYKNCSKGGKKFGAIIFSDERNIDHLENYHA